MTAESKITSEYGELAESLRGSTILVTGAAGFLGSALLFRLLHDPVIYKSVKQVLALIRGDSVESAAARLPSLLQPFTRAVNSNENTTNMQNPKLVVLNGDCQKAGYGLSDDMAKIAQRADIVIHAAGDARFTLSLQDAMGGVADLAYMSSRFSLTSPNVKTHIFISTSFVGWFLKPNSVVYEDFTQENISSNISENETHVNTYLYAKSLAEGCVNALFAPQAGRQLHGKAARILRLATLGPAAQFPKPGWGAGHTSSPVSAAIAAEPVHPDLFAPWLPDGAFLEILPVDIAASQIIALTAAVHQTHQLPLDALAHPRNPNNPVNHHGTNVPCYNVGSGLASFYQTHMLTLNMREIKLAKPYIPQEQLLKIYKPFISKIVNFDNSRTRNVLGIRLSESVQLSSFPNPDSSSSSGLSSPAPYTDRQPAITNGKVKSVEHVEYSDISLLTPKSGTAANIDRAWSDPPIDCGNLEVDCSLVIEKLWGELGGQNAVGWIGYLKCICKEMERKGIRPRWQSYLD